MGDTLLRVGTLTTSSRCRVRHGEASRALLAAMRESASRRPTSAERAAAEEHVAGCSDCWDVFVRVYEETTGVAPPDAARARELFGCERIQAELECFIGLTPEAL